MATVITSDGVFLNVELEFVNKCSVLKGAQEECGSDLFPIPNVNCRVLVKVIEFFRTGRLTDAEETMLQILMAADYLGYEELLDHGAKVVADNLRGKSANEIRSYFGLTTPVS